MSLTLPSPVVDIRDNKAGDRFRLHRAGILNVWQYDDQEFQLADGRMLLRGSNGAGKSKTLEMLLPFALDGDKARITASARHHTSLLWLMTDGYDGQTRVGYIWVEFLRSRPSGEPESFTCGVGIRSSASAKTATAWFFATTQRVGHDLLLEDAGGPLPRPRLEEAIGSAGQVFDKAAAYKEHVGRSLFGLNVGHYDEVLRLLYWLRQPQVGEDIEPSRLADQLAQSLPQLDEQTVKTAGDTFDELTAYGEQIERRTVAAGALASLADAYSRYARAAAAARGRVVVEVVKDERKLRSVLRRRRAELDTLDHRRETAVQALETARYEAESDRMRTQELEASPEARDQRRLGELASDATQQANRAEAAGDRAQRSEHEHTLRVTALSSTTHALLARLRGHLQLILELDSRRNEVGVVTGPTVSPVLDAAQLDGPERAALMSTALDESARSLTEMFAAIGQRQAAAQVVREALGRLDTARLLAESKEERAAEAEARWEKARAHLAGAEHEAAQHAQDLAVRLAEWAGEPSAPSVQLPDELTADAVTALPSKARDAADPRLTQLRADAQLAVTSRERADRRIKELIDQRVAIEAQRDPEPPPPALARTPRPDGAAFWKLVDFADHVDDADRAGLEAALQASGLLDAWVRPDGGLLGADDRDVLLRPVVCCAGRTLADVLHPDVAADSDVSATVVGRLLRGIQLRTGRDDPDDPDGADGSDGADGGAGSEAATVGPDGSWRLSPLNGRATKERAQYVGATARAQERRRRLDAVDRELEFVREEQAVAADQVAELEAAIQALETWLRRMPSADSLLAAWTKVAERRIVESNEEEANVAAQRAVHEARGAAARLHAEVDDLARCHGLPSELDKLAAVEERLRQLGHDVTSAADGAGSITRDVGRWTKDHTDVADAHARSIADRAEADEMTAVAGATAAALDELRASVGASVLELEQRLAALRDSFRHHQSEAKRLEGDVHQLLQTAGSTQQIVKQCETDLVAHHERRGEALEAMASLAEVPGLLESAYADTQAPEPTLLAGAATVPTGDQVPPSIVAAAESLSGRAPADEEPDVTVVWRAYNEATNGPASDHEPTVATFHDLVAVTARDDAGDGPIGRLADRVANSLRADRELLTQRERDRFEQHVLGELGDAIRGCRLEADELVAAMNELLGRSHHLTGHPGEAGLATPRGCVSRSAGGDPPAHPARWRVAPPRARRPA